MPGHAAPLELEHELPRDLHRTSLGQPDDARADISAMTPLELACAYMSWLTVARWATVDWLDEAILLYTALEPPVARA